MRVLITGGAGRVGRVLTRALQDEHDLVLGDVQPLDDPRYVPLDVRDATQVREAVARCDAVIHLAIADRYAGDTVSWEYAEAALQIQVVGTHHVLRAAVEAGNKRVLYASSLSAVWGYPAHQMVTSEHRHLGGQIYGVSKGFGEELCRMFHDEHGLPVVVLRLGHVYFEELRRDPPLRPGAYEVHESDVARAFALVLATETPRYALIHVVGDNPGRHWDLELAWALYHWRPEFRFGHDGSAGK
jgi:uronate dehydrogenase